MNEWMVEYTSPFYPPYFWAIIPDTRAEQSGNIRSRAALAAVLPTGIFRCPRISGFNKFHLRQPPN